MQINKVVVIGSGTMGSGISAQVANAGIPVILLDLPSKSEQRNQITENAKERIFDMTTPTLKVIPEEKPDINKVQTCSLLDKSAMSRDLFTEEECSRIIEMGRTWEQVDAKIQTKNPEEESEKNSDYRNCKMYPNVLR